MTAPNRPMYRPRSRGLMMSAMMTWLSAARPPAPMPCTARKAMSVPVSCEKPAAAVASTKIDDGELDEQLAVEQVGELAPDRGRDRGRQQRGGDDPGEGRLVAAEVVDDDAAARSRRRSRRASRRTCRAGGRRGPRAPGGAASAAAASSAVRGAVVTEAMEGPSGGERMARRRWRDVDRLTVE